MKGRLIKFWVVFLNMEKDPFKPSIGQILQFAGMLTAMGTYTYFHFDWMKWAIIELKKKKKWKDYCFFIGSRSFHAELNIFSSAEAKKGVCTQIPMS